MQSSKILLILPGGITFLLETYLVIFITDSVVTLKFVIGILEDHLQAITSLLHDFGVVVWHNIPKLSNMVIIDPQWLADAMAGVVTFICQGTATKNRGLVNWGMIRESIKLKYILNVQFIVTFSTPPFIGISGQGCTIHSYLCWNYLR